MKKTTLALKLILLSLTLFLSFNQSTFAQTCTATTSSTWNGGSTWGGTPHTSCTNFVIPAGITVNIPNNITINVTGTITINGTLTLNNNAVLNATGSIHVLGTGRINIGNATLNLGTTGSLSVAPTADLDASNPNAEIISGGVTYEGDDEFDDIQAAGYLQNGTLPIDLLSFTGKPIEDAIALKWETASEQNNAYIAIERSKDGVHFVEIDQKKGYGTTSEPKQYDWTDYSPLAGINYYRLRQVDYDGKMEYHPIIAVEFNGKVVQSGIRLYPTEIKDRINIILDTPLLNETTLHIIDMTGRILKRQKVAEGTVQQELQVNDLASGQYFITLPLNNGIQTARFVKL